MADDRSEYMRAYYEANKERLKAKRKPQPRTEAARRAEKKYREKRRVLQEIADMPSGPIALAAAYPSGR